MATKTYTVREGFCYRVTDERGNTKTYTEGDTLDLDIEVGDATHQLERSKPGKAAAPAADTQPGA